MSIGNQPTTAGQFNMQAANLAVQLRAVCSQILRMQAWVAQQGAAGLQNIGFSNTDAEAMLYQVGYINTVAQVYYGMVQQGGTGGAGASTFDFDNALTTLTGPS